MQCEINSINSSSLGSIVKIPERRKAIGSKWIYRVKTTPSGELDKLKSHLVVLGNRQIYGVDYADTHAPVARHETVTLVLTLIAGLDFEAECLDVCSAFLGSPLEDGYEVYLQMPDGVNFVFTKGELVLEKEKEVAGKNRKSWAILLKKSIYGLKQSPRQWYKTVTGYLSDLSFVVTSFDSGLLYYLSGGLLMLIVLFVDDLLLASGSSKLLQDVKSHFCAHFKVTESGNLASYIGLKIEWQRGQKTVTISQHSYLESILERFGFKESRSVSTPQEKGFSLFPSCPEDARCDRQRYQEAVGSLIYATTTTRPDLAYAVGVLARFSHDPAERHWAGVKRVFHYLKGPLDLVLTLGEDLTQLEGYTGSQFKSGFLVGYSDSDWGGDPATLQSTSGYAARLGTKGIICWRSTRQPTCAQSTAEAEYIACAHAVSQLEWMRGLLAEIGFESLSGEPSSMTCQVVNKFHSAYFDVVPPKFKTILFCDNQACIANIGDGNIKTSHKSIGVKYYGIRDRVACGEIGLHYCNTGRMVADGFTKALSGDGHRKFLDLIRMSEQGELLC